MSINDWLSWGMVVLQQFGLDNAIKTTVVIILGVMLWRYLRGRD